MPDIRTRVAGSQDLLEGSHRESLLITIISIWFMGITRIAMLVKNIMTNCFVYKNFIQIKKDNNNNARKKVKTDSLTFIVLDALKTQTSDQTRLQNGSGTIQPV